MNYPAAEVFDRLTIETRKRFYGADNEAQLAELEYEAERRALSLEPEKCGRLSLLTAKLGMFNSEIAALEWQLRQGDRFTFEEHGRRAVKIREINDNGRVKVKQEIAKLFGESPEQRQYGYGNGTEAEHLTLDVQERQFKPHELDERVNVRSIPDSRPYPRHPCGICGCEENGIHPNPVIGADCYYCTLHYRSVIQGVANGATVERTNG